MRMAVIGGGVMAEAILSRAIGLNILDASDVTISEPVPERRAALSDRLGVTTVSDNTNAILGSKIVLIAVKPQHMASVMSELNGNLSDNQTVVSIAAGISIDTLSNGLAHRNIIRVMPNTPATIGSGMSIWSATHAVPDHVKKDVSGILSALGTEMYVAEEDQIDVATAVSGSGPAYVFMFAEALITAGVKIGASEEAAKILASQTLLGAARMLLETSSDAGTLRKMVTSPGGTTAAALQVFEESEFHIMMEKAVIAAYNRAKELGRPF